MRHDLVKSVRLRLAPFTRHLPAEHHVRRRQIVFAVVAQDIFRKRMRYDAEPAACPPVVPEDLAHPVEHLRHMALHIVEPIALLPLHILIRHADDIVEKRIDAGVKIFDEVFLQRVADLREILPHILHKAGIMNGRGAVDHGIVMVEHQAGIFHAWLLRVGDEHSIGKKRPLVKRALFRALFALFTRAYGKKTRSRASFCLLRLQIRLRCRTWGRTCW